MINDFISLIDIKKLDYTLEELIIILEEVYNNKLANNTLLTIIKKQKDKEEKKDIWCYSPYKDLVKMQSNNVGNVGEEFINNICRITNIPANCNGTKMKKIGGDGFINNVIVEIKTAIQGSSSESFQHELGEVPWKYAEYLIFIDISPNCIYLSIIKNFDEFIYKNKKKLVCFPTKSITWRKRTGAFKLDTTIKINEKSILDGNTIKITPLTSNKDIGIFINSIII
jgi:hypothetical protein